MANNGNFEEIFEVTRQVNNGPDLSTKYFKLMNNQHVLVEVEKNNLNKLHSYKNYKCQKHDFFFKVNLFSERQVHNSHHMRPNPTSKISKDVLEQFVNTD